MSYRYRMLPRPLAASDRGSFAYRTITERLPTIARRVLAENDLPLAAVARLSALIADIGQDRLRWFGDDGAPDIPSWERYAAPFFGRHWTEIPACFAETYFYRAVLAATGYFRPGPGYRRDPYGEQKRLGVLTATAAIRPIAERLNAVCVWGRSDALAFIYGSLWGNRADLCLWPIDAAAGQGPQTAPPASSPYLLVDEAPRLIARLEELRAARVDIIVDNAGFELVCDLALADYLLITGRAASVELHLKGHPTFVSDATPADVLASVALLADQPDMDTQVMARRLQRHLADGRLRLHTDPFWTSPLVFWDLPAHLSGQLAGAALVLVKGDMNYRRLLGDRLWRFTTPFAEIVDYFPAPLAALRTIKAELAAGLEPGQILAAHEHDPEWLRSGRWGLIQLAEPVRLPAHIPSRPAVMEAA